MAAQECDLSALTDAELQTMKTNLLAAHVKSTGANEYQIGQRRLRRETGMSIIQQLASVSAEISARADDTFGIGITEFNEAV